MTLIMSGWTFIKMMILAGIAGFILEAIIGSLI